MKAIFKVLVVVMTVTGIFPVFGQNEVIYPLPVLHEGTHIWGYAYNHDRKKMAINYMFDEANQFESASGLAIVEVDGFRGAIDIDGKFVIEPIYTSVSYQPYSNTYVVQKDEKYGAMNTNGDLIIPIKYDGLSAQQKPGWYEAIIEDDYFYIAPDGHITHDWSEYLNAPNN